MKQPLSKPFLYVVAVISSLSTAGATMTLLALSSAFFIEYPDGILSSAIFSMYYLGIGCVGIVGGGLLQKYSICSIGIWGPLISALIVFYLAMIESISPFIGLPAIFLIFLLNGLDHPNNLRFFNEALPEKEKMAFFSFTEATSAMFTIASPILAGLIIAKFGVKVCFLIDGATYLISCLPWLKLRKVGFYNEKLNEKINWLIGFKTIYSNFDVRSLTIGRLLVNLAYVSCTTAVPLILARITSHSVELFSSRQGFVNSLVSCGFIGASIIGIKIGKNSKLMLTLIYLSSLLGFLSYVLLIASLELPGLIYSSALLLGIGTYCFRISGMTLGQAFTPPSILAPVIIAGDTAVRLWSFFVSLITVFIYQLGDTLGLSLINFFALALFVPAFSLLAPFWTLHLARAFVQKNQKHEGDIHD